MTKDAYKAFMLATNIERSGKASSYIRALDLLSQMLAHHPMGFSDCIDIWTVSSLEHLEALRQRVLEEQRNARNSSSSR